MKFSQLGLAEPFLRATEALGYKTTTPIQAKAIPIVLSGGDLIGCAQTGTGKTAAFTLPMLDRLMQTLPAHSDNEPAGNGKPAGNNKQAGNGRGRRPKDAKGKLRILRALILAPTRELAAQICDSLDRYGQFTSLRQTVVFGGVSQHHQVRALRHGVDALVATPGRLLDLMAQGYIDLSKIEILILDEADQMLDMGFLPALNRIVAAVPRRRQTLMFSATMPEEIRRLAQQWLTAPVAVQVAPVAAPAERIAQSVHLVDKKRKPDLLSHFLKEIPQSRTLVFSRTKHGADKIVKRLRRDGLHAAAIHGNKSQGARSRALAQFKGKGPPVLVATDIAARGLDINNVSHVVNFDLPEMPETYVHRIGRTARAGAGGIAVSFCAADERGLLKQIERLTKLAIRVEPTIDGFEPTDPISQGRPYKKTSVAMRQKPGKKPRRHEARAEASHPADQRSYNQNHTGDVSGHRRKKKRSGGAPPSGPARKQRRRRSTGV